jgi:hypothetical protein
LLSFAFKIKISILGIYLISEVLIFIFDMGNKGKQRDEGSKAGKQKYAIINKIGKKIEEQNKQVINVEVFKTEGDGFVGKDPVSGKFLHGNQGGQGGPYHRRMKEVRIGILQATSAEKARQLMNKLHEIALEGDVKAATLWLQYAAGPPQAVDVFEKIESLEKRITELVNKQ